MEGYVSQWVAQGSFFAKIKNKKRNPDEYTYACMASINKTVENYPSFET